MPNGESLRLGDVGFAEFTATLLRETLEALIAAQLDQEEKIRTLLEMTELDPGRFVEEVVPVEAAEQELARLLPSENATHSAVAGAPYSSARADAPEAPPIFERTGYQMQEEDFDAQGSVITEAGAANILNHTRRQLAEAQRTHLVSMAQSGIPRIVVDSGRVNAKLTFQLSKTSIPGGSTPAAAGLSLDPSPATRLPSARIQSIQQSIKPLIFQVKPVDPRRPEITRASANVVGEVEFTFKTIFT